VSARRLVPAVDTSGCRAQLSPCGRRDLALGKIDTNNPPQMSRAQSDCSPGRESGKHGHVRTDTTTLHPSETLSRPLAMADTATSSAAWFDEGAKGGERFCCSISKWAVSAGF